MSLPDSESTHNLYPRLVADIGGTHARFGLVHGSDAAVADIASLRCADFATLELAARTYLNRVAADCGRRVLPRRAAFAIAAPIDGDTIRLTNSAWVISRQHARSALDLDDVHLLNDFEALALALPHLGPDDVTHLGGGAIDRTKPMAVIGPGTGLGTAACVPCGNTWRAVAGEGGHVTASATDDFESEILRVVRRRFPHVSAERLLSGLGLPLLHRAVAQVRGEPVADMTAEEISRAAREARDPLCIATLDTFCAMLGSFAGNVALAVGARGGVFIAGGIPLALGELFLRSRFRQRFEAKGRFQSYLAGIATVLITAADAALQGAARSIEDRQSDA